MVEFFFKRRAGSRGNKDGDQDLRRGSSQLFGHFLLVAALPGARANAWLSAFFQTVTPSHHLESIPQSRRTESISNRLEAHCARRDMGQGIEGAGIHIPAVATSRDDLRDATGRIRLVVTVLAVRIVERMSSAAVSQLDHLQSPVYTTRPWS
jgi:hypothetical protein